MFEKANELAQRPPADAFVFQDGDAIAHKAKMWISRINKIKTLIYQFFIDLLRITVFLDR